MCVNTINIWWLGVEVREKKGLSIWWNVRKNMQMIRSKDTSIEVLLRKRLRHDGYHNRKNYKNT